MSSPLGGAMLLNAPRDAHMGCGSVRWLGGGDGEDGALQEEGSWRPLPVPPQDSGLPGSLVGQNITLRPMRSPQWHLVALNSAPEVLVEPPPRGLCPGERLLMPHSLWGSGMPWPCCSSSLSLAPVLGCDPLVPTPSWLPKSQPWQRRGLSGAGECPGPVGPSPRHGSGIQDGSGHPGPAASPAPFSARRTPQR